ncbi:hypothetical protein KGMB02408_19690 [Bacteroides faecalis]|uniref:Uncharacterized protein n=1 Tax=Bacteroides faecalis TaxID=2447885 RepID=A0A401LU44_9BACE|nr:hypothetical protein KGMB02408_19690 [Bacteroides faecalis]
MNELINKDNEWIIHFMGSLDRLLDNYERLTANYRPTLGGERFFTDKGGFSTTEGKSKNTSRLPQRRTDSLYPIRWQNPLP